MLGQRLKELREEKGLVQREVAAKLEIDTAYVSKMEKGDKQISRNWLPILADLFAIDHDQLTLLWLADKVERQIFNEKLAAPALKLVLTNLNVEEN